MRVGGNEGLYLCSSKSAHVWAHMQAHPLPGVNLSATGRGGLIEASLETGLNGNKDDLETMFSVIKRRIILTSEWA